MSILTDKINDSNVIAVTGHVRPDGDCVGSTTALYYYILENYPEKKVYLTLDTPPASVKKCIDCDVITAPDSLPDKVDLFVSLDSSTSDRLLEAAVEKFNSAGVSFVVDHHKTNIGFGDINHIDADASSCCEVLFELLDYDKISVRTASSLYLGIVHDTGVFKYSSTSKRTMEVAGKLLAKGVDSAFIIDTSFYEKTWKQNKLLARAIDKAEISEDGKIAYTVISQADLSEFGCGSSDTEGIVEQLRLTEGVEIAIFMREDAANVYKVSMRAKAGLVDVSEISVLYNGGGHSKAAGFTAHGNYDEIIANVISEVNKRWTV